MAISKRLPSALYEMTRARYGAAIYAEIVFITQRYHGQSTFRDFKFDWSLVEQGYCDLAKQFPNMDVVAERFCKLACYAGQRATANYLFTQYLGEHANFDAWNVEEKDGIRQRWQTWAARSVEGLGKTLFELPRGTQRVFWLRRTVVCCVRRAMVSIKFRSKWACRGRSCLSAECRTPLSVAMDGMWCWQSNAKRAANWFFSMPGTARRQRSINMTPLTTRFTWRPTIAHWSDVRWSGDQALDTAQRTARTRVELPLSLSLRRRLPRRALVGHVRRSRERRHHLEYSRTEKSSIS